MGKSLIPEGHMKDYNQKKKKSVSKQVAIRRNSRKSRKKNL